jgi:thioredoxin 1
MKPVVGELAADYPEVCFMTLDADANQRVVVEHRVLSMPTFLVFRGGHEVLRLVGARSKRRMAAELDEALRPAVTAAG